MIKLSFLGDIMCLKAQNDAVMKKHGEYRYFWVSSSGSRKQKV